MQQSEAEAQAASAASARAAKQHRDDKVWAAGQQLHSLGLSSQILQWLCLCYSCPTMPREAKASLLRWDLVLTVVLMSVGGASARGVQVWGNNRSQQAAREHIVLEYRAATADYFHYRIIRKRDNLSINWLSVYYHIWQRQQPILIFEKL